MCKAQEITKEIKVSDEETSERSGAPMARTPRCNPAKEPTCGLCTEGISLDRQIREAEEALATLKAKRASNKTQINTSHDPLSLLPTELVSDIFMCLRPLPMEVAYRVNVDKPDDVAKSMKTPLLLGAVCRAWRTFAWSIPQLWSTISVNVYNKKAYLPDLIHQWLARSGHLPLSIYLYTAQRRVAGGALSPHPYGEELFVKRLMAVINKYSGRWLYLNLDIPKRFMLRVHCSGSEAPMLETLTLRMLIDFDEIEDGELDSDEKIKIGRTPNLKRISASPLQFNDIDMDWASVTHAEFWSLGLKMICDLLRHAPILTHLTLHDITVDTIDSSSSIVRHQTLISLQITGDGWEDGPNELLLTYLDLPALEDLGIYACTESNLTTVADFLRRSSCTLKKFRVNMFDDWLEHKRELITLLDNMPSLEYLYLECQYDESDGSPLESQLPTPAMIHETRSINQQLFLPNLKRVRVKVGLDSESYSLGLLLRPDRPYMSTPRRSEGNHFVPSNNLRLNPLHIYFLLDMEIQRTLHPIIKSNFKIKMSTPYLNSFVEFVRKSLIPTMEATESAI